MKISKQEKFLKEHFLLNRISKEKTRLYDISMSANHSHKYFAEVLNVVECYRDKNTTMLKKPVFITATLDGCYRDFLKSDFSRIDFKQIHKEMPKHLRRKALNNQAFDLKDLRDVLGYQFKKILDCWRYIAPNRTRDYIKVLEPHKNGVPHLHALLYVDEKDIVKLKKSFTI